MFNRSEIMKAAWARFRAIPMTYSPKQIREGWYGTKFSHCLRMAWFSAKARIRDAANEAQIAATYGAKADEAKSIIGEIDALNYKPWRINIAPAQAALQSRLQALA